MFDRMFEHMNYLDWGIVAAYFTFAIILGVYHSRRATSGIENYFASGRGMAWWVLGTSMVATTFAADTPLAVSGMVVKYGIARNWFWWSFGIAHLLGVFLFSRLWRRSRVLTDTELAEFRYGGKSAAFLRGFRGLYFSIVFNCIVIGWVNLAMVKVLHYTVGIDETTALYLCFAFSVAYTMLAGLTGVMVTDFIQFAMAMFGAIYLAVVSVKGIGGLAMLGSRLAETYGADRAAEMTRMFPATAEQMFLPVVIFLGFQWWSAFNTDSGAYLAQRMIAAKDERHSFLGLLWFTIAHYCLRPWPWIIVGLVAAILYPYVPDAAGNLPDPEAGYIKVMLRFLPHGMLGVVVASFLAAYMSTIDTHLNWGASYIINDFYKRFIVRGAPDRHYVIVAFVATVGIALIGICATKMMDSIVGAWYIATAIYAGLGIVYMLRWYWWRINAWSEIGAMTAALIGTAVFRWYLPARLGKTIPFVFNGNDYNLLDFPFVLLLIVPIAFGTSMLLTFLTPPVEEEKLVEFYKRVRPGGALWRRISSKIPGAEKDPGPGQVFPGYIISIVAVYSALIGLGKLLLGPAWVGVALLCLSFVSGLLLWKYIGSVKFMEEGNE